MAGELEQQIAANRDEILRLRERLHSVESKLVGVEWHVSDFKEWRAEMRTVIHELDESLSELSRTDQIALAVSQQVRRDVGRGWTMLQKTGAAVVALVVVAGSIKGLL